MPSLLAEEFPTACENWLDDGDGWVDLLELHPTWPGDLSIWANAVCSSTAAAPQSWSTLKGLYRL